MMPIVKVWYDSECPLCAREIGLMRRLDKRGAVRFVDIRAGVDCPIDRSELLARFHAQEGDGPVVSGAAAFAAMWRAIPPLRPLGLIARNPIVLWVLEKAYLGFLVIRPTLQRLLLRREALPGSRQ
jgi:predicted DCC family thiol-disulfide oxidoreductase YuxK